MENLISQKIKEITENGKLDEIVTQRVNDLISDILRDSFSSYSDVTKKFKENLNSKIIEGFEKIDFVQYSKILTDLVESELNKSILEIGILPIKEMISNFVGALEKKEWKLSEVIEKYKEEEVIPEEYGESGKIYFTNKTSEYGNIHIGFDKDCNVNKSLYSCKYRLMIDGKTKKLYSPHIEGKNIHPVTEIGLRGFDLFLFKLYAMQCTIDCDFNNVESEWSTYND